MNTMEQWLAGKLGGPTPDPSQEGNRLHAFGGRVASCLIPSSEGAGVGFPDLSRNGLSN